MIARTFLTVFFFIASSAVAIIAQERYVRPVDEAALDASFSEFRTKLINAAEKHDAAYIIRILDPEIRVSFGDDGGIADFKRFWKINSKNSKFWNEFLPVIKNGGSWTKGEKGMKTFWAPYTFNSWPEDLDAFEHHVIFGSNVNLRESPDIGSPVVSQLSYNVVTVESDPDTAAGRIRENSGWSKVRTLGGKQGWTSNVFVRSPIDYRAAFDKIRGVWKMTAFVAGD